MYREIRRAEARAVREIPVTSATHSNYPEYYAVYPNCNALTADTNCDGLANAFDIDSFANCVLNSGCACPPP